MTKQKNIKYTVRLQLINVIFVVTLQEWTNKIHKIIQQIDFNSITKQCQMCYLHRGGRKEILYTAFRCWTRLCLFFFHVPSSFCLIVGFQPFLCSAGGCTIGAQRVVQFKWMVLVNQVESASMAEFPRLAPAQLLTIQETGIGTQLWRKKKTCMNTVL